MLVYIILAWILSALAAPDWCWVMFWIALMSKLYCVVKEMKEKRK